MLFCRFERPVAIYLAPDVRLSLGCPMPISFARMSAFNTTLVLNAQLLRIFLFRGGQGDGGGETVRTSTHAG